MEISTHVAVVRKERETIKIIKPYCLSVVKIRSWKKEQEGHFSIVIRLTSNQFLKGTVPTFDLFTTY